MARMWNRISKNAFMALPTSCWDLLIAFVLLSHAVGIARAVGEEATEDWVASCRRSGFDPWQLACKTCKVFDTDTSTTSVSPKARELCLRCCQSYKDVERITQPYEAAVLVLPGSSRVGDELQLLLDENWDELTEAKGADRLTKVKREIDPPTRGFSPFFLRRPAATILFLDQKLTAAATKGKKLDYDAYEKIAKEEITLDGWKREDMKDMLQTLLK